MQDLEKPNRDSAALSTVLNNDFVFLFLDCYSYVAGEKVTGEVLIDITEPISNAQLKFSAKGLEEVSVFDQSDRSKLITNDSLEIFFIDGALKTWEALNPGQYVFPFTLKLPSFSPSTFYYSTQDLRGNYIKAEISYKIHTVLQSSNEIILSHTRSLLIKNKQDLSSPLSTIECTEHIRGCCVNKGLTNFKLSVMNSEHVVVNGEVSYKLVPDNSNCAAPINLVVGNIMLEFEVNTTRGIFKVIHNISKVERATWISGYSGLIFEKDFEYKSSVATSDLLNSSSNSTPLIKCMYFIEVLVYYDIMFSDRPVSIMLPFHVNPLNDLPKEIPKLPEKWAPLEFEISALIADLKSGYTPGEPLQRSNPAEINI